MSGPFWLVALRGKNFRSFPVLEVAFQRNGLTLARGHNLDTGGSSYSGKSTIGLAVAWALGYLPFSAKDQRRWGTDGPCYVELDVGTEAGVGTIRVGDKAFFKTPDGRKITSATAIRDEVARFLGVTPDVLSALSWQRQKKGSRFLAKTDSEKKEFLSNVMPFLTKLEQVADSTEITIKKLETEAAMAEALVQQKEAELRSAVVSEPVLVAVPDDGIPSELIAAELAVQQQKEIVRAELEQAESVPVPVASGSGIEELQAAANQCRDRLAAVRAAERDRIALHNDLVAMANRTSAMASNQAAKVNPLRAELKVLETNYCPTCHQQWVDAAQRVVACKEQLVVALAAQEELPGLILEARRLVFEPDPKIAQLEGVAKNIEQQLGVLLNEKQRLIEQRDARVDAIEAKIAELDKLSYVNRLAMGQAEHAAAIARKENAHRQADYDAAIQRRTKIADVLTGLRDQAHAQRAAVQVEQDFQALIGRGGFLGSIFDEVLEEISVETNAILRAVANTAHVSIEFQSEAVTQKGKVNKVITPVVTIGGNVADLESGASGGMGTSIGLAVDLAVATVVSRRTNTWPGWLILDESFEGLDQVSKESCMEMLKAHACNRMVLVIDHASETKELFSNFIDIEFQNGVSKVLT